jgi:hypothetical protein
MDAAQWSNMKTFSKCYDKPIEPEEKENFGHNLLKIVNVYYACIVLILLLIKKQTYSAHGHYISLTRDSVAN